MYRCYDLDLAELSHNENVGLLPYSPIACGMLSGKYRQGKKPAGSRITINSDLYGRVNENALLAVEAYCDIAIKHGLDPAQMAIAFCLQRPFVASAIIGATSIEQLASNIAASEIILDKPVLDDIQKVYRQYPIPF